MIVRSFWNSTDLIPISQIHIKMIRRKSRKEGRKTGRKQGRKEEKKEGR